MKDELNVDMTRGITRWFAQEKNYVNIENLVESPFHRLKRQTHKAVDVFLNFFHRFSNTFRQNFELKTCRKSATKRNQDLVLDV